MERDAVVLLDRDLGELVEAYADAHGLSIGEAVAQLTALGLDAVRRRMRKALRGQLPVSPTRKH